MNRVMKFSSRVVPFLLPHAKTIKHTPLQISSPTISAAKRDFQMPLRFFGSGAAFEDPIPSPTIAAAAKKRRKRDIQMPLLNERKVCIVCSGSVGSTREYMVFVVDLKWESDVSCDEIVTSVTPTVRFDTDDFFLADFCVVGSTLYVFDGYDDWRKDNPAGDNSMYTYQLSDGISNLKLEKHMLSKGPPMNQVKVNPKAAVTPNGKILVFSRTSTWFECEFELYDPVDGVWQQLPSLRPSTVHGDNSVEDFSIQSFTFMKGGNVFFVETRRGSFSLDITARKKVWKRNGLQCARGLPLQMGNTLVVINKEICIVPFTAIDITEYEDQYEKLFQHGVYYDFPDLSKCCYDKYSYLCGGVLLLENRAAASKVFDVCFLYCGFNTETKDSEMVLQVYSCNLEECRKELRKYRQKNRFERKVDTFELPGAKKVKSLRIVVKYEGEPDDDFGYCSYTSIPSIEKEIACIEKGEEVDGLLKSCEDLDAHM